jgi:uncharacterized protein (TIGR02118 family)
VVKLVFCLRRLPHLTREEFQRYWREEHAPLVRKHAPTLGIKRYVQTHTLDTPMNQATAASRSAPEEYDGVAELWWESLESYAQSTATDEGRQAAIELLEDERKFIDHSRSPLWLNEENLVVGA